MGTRTSEIAGQLFQSQHTVAYHLRKLYTQLGIKSRRELETALARAPSLAVTGTS